MKFFAFSLLMAVSVLVNAETMPFKTVEPYAGDEKKIIVLMKYDCPYCRGYHASLDHWAKSIPAQYHLEFHPVLEKTSTGEFTAATLTPFIIYHGLEKAGATDVQLTAFSEAAYSIEQDSRSVNDRAAWLRAGAATGLPATTIASGIQAAVSDYTNEEQRQIHYNPRATPTIIVCGKYEFTPDNVSGMPQLLIQLLNGTLSQCMIDQGNDPK